MGALACVRVSDDRRTDRWTMRVASAALAVLAMLAPAAPVAAAAGDGVFESRGFPMPVGGALAYRGKGMLDKSDVIVVAISNAEFRARAPASIPRSRCESCRAGAGATTPCCSSPARAAA